MKLVPDSFTRGGRLRQRLLQAGLAALAPALFAQPANVDLPKAAKGEAAIEALGKNLPAVASYYGLHPSELAQLLKIQRSLGVDQKGALLYACEGLAVNASGALVDASASSGGTVANMMTPDSSVTKIANGEAVDALKLHSLPGVGRVIFLDFDGHTTTGTSWNNTSRPSISSAPFDRDGNPSSFNAEELSMIQKIWQRVAEDYAPFGVDVTTEDPGLAGLTKSSSSDLTYGVRVVISPSNWYNTGAGGVAYIGSFSWNSDTPCFAFTQQLANNEKYIAECVSHEVGHTVSLNHDGQAGGTEYYQGQGNWAPIMGVGYYKPLVQFSKGEYANANNTQDDLNVMLSHFPLAADDHSNSTSNATTLAGPNVKTGGTIETRTDVDYFRLDVGAGAISLAIQGPAPDSNVDLQVELLNAGGGNVATSDSTSTYGASIAANVGAGTYYLKVSSVGVGDPASTGYSSYGSIGNYLITGTTTTGGVNQPPTAVAGTTTGTSGVAPFKVDFTSAGSTDSDGNIVNRSWTPYSGATAIGEPASYTYANPGTYTAGLTVTDNGGLVGTDIVVINVAAAPVAPNSPPTAVASGTNVTGQGPLTVNFSSAGSNDSDGNISSYSWNFGDGTSSNVANPSKTYSTAGNYSARLTVTDNGGASATSSAVDVSVTANPALSVDVTELALTAIAAKGGTNGVATAYVRDSTAAVAGVSVTVQWSGVVSGTSTGVSDGSGKVIVTSPKTKKGGTATATVISVNPPTGRSYNPSLFAPASAPTTSVRLN